MAAQSQEPWPSGRGFTAKIPWSPCVKKGCSIPGRRVPGRADIASKLRLRQKGQRRVATANGFLYAAEHVVRIGFLAGDLTDPNFRYDMQQPYVLEHELIAFELHAGFSHPVLIGMDVIAAGDLTVSRHGTAEFVLP